MRNSASSLHLQWPLASTLDASLGKATSTLHFDTAFLIKDSRKKKPYDNQQHANPFAELWFKLGGKLQQSIYSTYWRLCTDSNWSALYSCHLLFTGTWGADCSRLIFSSQCSSAQVWSDPQQQSANGLSWFVQNYFILCLAELLASSHLVSSKHPCHLPSAMWSLPY